MSSSFGFVIVAVFFSIFKKKGMYKKYCMHEKLVSSFCCSV